MWNATRPGGELASQKKSDLRPIAAIALALSMLLPQWTVAAPMREIQLARDALTVSARAYRTVRGLKETLTYVLKGPNTDKEPKPIHTPLRPATIASPPPPLIHP